MAFAASVVPRLWPFARAAHRPPAPQIRPEPAAARTRPPDVRILARIRLRRVVVVDGEMLSVP